MNYYIFRKKKKFNNNFRVKNKNFSNPNDDNSFMPGKGN